jgi:hypothetical protein
MIKNPTNTANVMGKSLIRTLTAGGVSVDEVEERPFSVLAISVIQKK